MIVFAICLKKDFFSDKREGGRMERQKIERFLELLDGVTEKEWSVLKSTGDRLYKMAALENTPLINEKSIAYFADEIEATIHIYDGIKAEANKIQGKGEEEE